MRLFRDRIFVVCVTMGALLGSVLVGGVTFLPLFLQVVDGASATSSGLLLVPLMAGVVIGSNVTGRMVSRSGRYRKFPIVGLAMAILGVSALATIDADTGRLLISASMGVLGLGVGCSMPVLMVAVQNAAAFPDMGVATSAVNFFRTLGSAFGVALFGTVVRVRLNATLEERLPGSELAADRDLLGSPSVIRELPTEQFDAVADGIASGVGMVFVVAAPVMVVAFVLAWFLDEIPLRDELAPASTTE
jgi:MFS family permease